MANQAVSCGQTNFANHIAVMYDGLCDRNREQPPVDQRAQRVGIIRRVPRPPGKPFMMCIKHFRHGKLPLLAEGRQRFICRHGIVEHQRGFKAVAHGGAGKFEVFLRVLL